MAENFHNDATHGASDSSVCLLFRGRRLAGWWETGLLGRAVCSFSVVSPRPLTSAWRLCHVRASPSAPSLHHLLTSLSALWLLDFVLSPVRLPQPVLPVACHILKIVDRVFLVARALPRSLPISKVPALLVRVPRLPPPSKDTAWLRCRSSSLLFPVPALPPPVTTLPLVLGLQNVSGGPGIFVGVQAPGASTQLRACRAGVGCSLWGAESWGGEVKSETQRRRPGAVLLLNTAQCLYTAEGKAGCKLHKSDKGRPGRGPPAVAPLGPPLPPLLHSHIFWVPRPRPGFCPAPPSLPPQNMRVGVCLALPRWAGRCRAYGRTSSTALGRRPELSSVGVLSRTQCRQTHGRSPHSGAGGEAGRGPPPHSRPRWSTEPAHLRGGPGPSGPWGTLRRAGAFLVLGGDSYVGRPSPLHSQFAFCLRLMDSVM